jgi:hypothetical protein
VFRHLENPEFFCELGDNPPIPAYSTSMARADYGTVTWSGDVDITLETHYEYSVPLAS